MLRRHRPEEQPEALLQPHRERAEHDGREEQEAVRPSHRLADHAVGLHRPGQTDDQDHDRGVLPGDVPLARLAAGVARHHRHAPGPPPRTSRLEIPGLRRLYDWTLRLAAHPRAQVWLAIVSFAESSVFPIPPDVILAPMAVARPDLWWRSALICTAASAAGGVAGYLIGWGLYEAVALPIIDAYRLHEANERFRELYLRYDWLVVAIAGFTPIPYKLATIASGAVGMGILPFLIASIASRGARFFMVALVAAKFGPPVLAVIEKRLTLFTILFLVLLVGGFALVRLL